MKFDKKICLVVLVTLIIGANSLSCFYISGIKIYNYSLEDKSFIKSIRKGETQTIETINVEKNSILKTAKISNTIYINNWSEAKSMGICTGDGTYSSPYLLKDLVIDGRKSNSCISIENSTKYFKIENCTLYNAGEGDEPNYIAGIRLNNTSNGIIKNNTCHSNEDDGMTITFCKNITIINNNFHNNGKAGLYLENSNNISINSNIFKSNLWAGILFDKSNDTYVSNNTIINNEYGGLEFFEYCYNFTIIDNLFVNNSFNLFYSYFINILNNNFTNSYLEFYGEYDYLDSLVVNIKNRINGHPIYQYKDNNNLNFENFTKAGFPGQIILVNCNNSIISNLNFSKEYAGISIFNSNNNRILSCNLTDNDEGILLSSIFNFTIIKNTLVNNRGIRLWDSCNNNTFYNNTLLNTNFGIEFHGPADYNNISNNFINSNDGSGIKFEDDWSNYNWIINNILVENYEYGIKIDGIKNILLNNIMTNCGIQIEASSKEYAGTQIIDFSNKVNGKSVYYYGNKEYLNPNNFSKAGFPGQIILGNCSHSKITDFSIFGSSVAISLIYCNNITITRNTLSENAYIALSLYYSCNNSIFNNDFVNNDGYGIILYEYSSFNNISNNRVNNNVARGIELYRNCCNNTISTNTINSNEQYGIFLQYQCNNNSIIYNTITKNFRGVCLYYECQFNLIAFNDISNNEDDAISLRECNYTLILGNKIRYNGYGYRYSYYPTYEIIYYNGYGVYLEESFNNTVTENEFLDNKFNIIEVDCRYNKIFNNSFLITAVVGVGGGEDDGNDSNKKNEYNTILVLLIIISSIGALSSISLYYYYYRNKKQKQKPNFLQKKRFQESNKMVELTPSSKEILTKLTKKDLLLQIFELKASEKVSDNLDNLDLTVISHEFLKKLDSIIIGEEEKREFIREMLLFSPEERNEILDNIIKRLNSYSEGVGDDE